VGVGFATPYPIFCGPAGDIGNPSELPPALAKRGGTPQFLCVTRLYSSHAIAYPHRSRLLRQNRQGRPKSFTAVFNIDG